MRVLVAMSGGVDSSVAAARLCADGHEVVGATMKLWGGSSDSGCCSVGDVEDARRVAQQLGITHHVFNFSDQFDRHVVEPYVAAHAAGRTPNPCVECNRHLKFDRLLARADVLGFDAVATGHHAQVVGGPQGWQLRRGRDPEKDQSYVLHMLTQAALARLRFPIGGMTKAEVRAEAAALGLRTAAKPDSQDVCFISRTGGREAFLGARIPLRPGRVVDGEGLEVARVAAIELVTLGQRRGLGLVGSGPGVEDRRYAVAVDVAGGTVTVGGLDQLLVDELAVGAITWTASSVEAGTAVEVQMSAHGRPVPGWWEGEGRLRLGERVRRVAPGQSVVLYQDDRVLGGGISRETVTASG